MKYFKQAYIRRIDIESRPQEDLGFDYDIDEDYHTLGDTVYRAEADLVSLDVLISTLNTLKDEGANYVACDWHCDHGELKVHGFTFIVAPQEDVDAHLESVKAKTERKKEQEIKALEEKLKKLKGE